MLYYGIPGPGPETTSGTNELLTFVLVRCMTMRTFVPIVILPTQVGSTEGLTHALACPVL